MIPPEHRAFLGVLGWILAVVLLVALVFQSQSRSDELKAAVEQRDDAREEASHQGVEINRLEEEVLKAQDIIDEFTAKFQMLERRVSRAVSEQDELKDEQKDRVSEPVRESSPLDEGAVLQVLKTYTSLYNAGGYSAASTHVSIERVQECGGSTGLSRAMSQNHQIEEIDYGVASVKAWSDEPNMADVVSIERWQGDSTRFTLGLAFAFENGQWKLDDIYPLGVGAFC